VSSAHFHLPLKLSCWLLVLAEDKHTQNLNEDKKGAGKILNSDENFHRKK